MKIKSNSIIFVATKPGKSVIDQKHFGNSGNDRRESGG